MKSRYLNSVVRYAAPLLLVSGVAVAGSSVDHARVIDVEPVYRSVEYFERPSGAERVGAWS